MLDYETLCKEDHGLEKQLVNFRSADQALTAYQPCDSIHKRGREGRERERGRVRKGEVGGTWGVGMGVQKPSQRGAKAAVEEDRAVLLLVTRALR